MKDVTVIYRPKSLSPRIVTLTVPGALEGSELDQRINIVLGTNWVWPAK